ncbi:MAG: BrnT family toxin [Bryobacterales bacterium]|nr:BrnT family toxin [Bryobacterales bacterium]
MRFEWDEEKNESNERKHGISFETAALVFEDANRLMFIERIEKGEERWHAIGSVKGSYLFLTVVHTYAEEHAEIVVRIISARRATRHERKLYAEAIP